MLSSIVSLVGGYGTLAVGGVVAAGVGFLWLRMTYFKSRYTSLKTKYENLNRVYQENLKTYENVSKQYKASIALLKQAADRDVVSVKKQAQRQQVVEESTRKVENMNTVDPELADTLNNVLGTTPK